MPRSGTATGGKGQNPRLSGRGACQDPTNEPGIHAPWLYNALGQPWKTQATVRQILDTVYGTGPAGLPGNDDLGTMSAWYVFSALGLYPQTPGSANLLVGAPLFPHAVVDRPGRDIVIDAPAADADHAYVSGVRLDGRPYDRSWTDARFLRDGGTLTFRLAAEPDTRWATAPAGLPR